MYHLTCPTCEDVTESAFVRSGAVVRCSACSQKYRIKSAHFERVLETGPRTLDEADSVLRSDSVDIDPDEDAPVSIDDDGNVVGLSGLSELMRWSDEGSKAKNGQASPRKAKEALEARLEADEDQTHAPLVEAKQRGAATASPGSKAAPNRRRSRQRKRKNQTPLLILAVVFGVLVGGGIVILLVDAMGGPSEERVSDTGPSLPQPAPQPDTPPDTGPGSGSNTPPEEADDPQPDPSDTDGTEPGPIRPDPDTPDPKPDDGDTTILLAENGLPLAAPTELLPSQAINFEDWYLLDPPRDPTEPEIGGGLAISEPFRPQGRSQDQVLITGKVRNGAVQAMVHGEVHIMLQDQRGRVFAETYVPVMMLDSGLERAVTIPLDSKHWSDVREVEIGFKALSWVDNLDPIKDLRTTNIKGIDGTAIRISKLNDGETPIQAALFHIRALDTNGDLIKQFVLQKKGMNIEKDKWLDILVATPFDEGIKPAAWDVKAYRVPNILLN